MSDSGYGHDDISCGHFTWMCFCCATIAWRSFEAVSTKKAGLWP